ncbi:MAG: hypothetical protein ACTSSI_16500 [Candidatus Helarchaeota archaeon]
MRKDGSESLLKLFSENVSKPLQDIASIETLIIKVVKQLKKEIPESSTENLMELVEDLEKIDFSKPLKVVVAQPASSAPARSSYLNTASGPPATSQADASEALVQEVPADTEWTESELEGFKVFDTVIAISKWKMRDFEAQKGTREEFAIAWRKLSGPARKEIRNGAWSKAIITKIKMLGRSRYD